MIFVVAGTALLAPAGCTQPKASGLAPIVPASTPTPPPLDDVNATPVPFPDGTASAATPVPTPTPTPRIGLVEPVSTTDFSVSSVNIAFTADTSDNRAIVNARVLYEGRELARLEGGGPLFRLENWNPNVLNNLADPPVLTPVPSGDRRLTIEVSDEAKRTGRVEINFFKPLRLVEWQEIASMPLPTSQHALMSDNAEPPAFVSLWGSVTGAEDIVLPRSQSYAFVPGLRPTWSTITLAGTAVPRGGYAVAPHPGGQFQYLVGGRSGNTDLGVVDLHAPLRKMAESLTTVGLITPRTDACAAVVDEYLYVFGGRRGGQVLNAVERVKLGRDGLPTGAFEARAESLNARAGAYAFAQGKEVWLIGGGHRPIEIYDTAKDTWRLLTDAGNRNIGTPETWAYAATVAVNGRLFFFGGIRDGGQPTERIYEFNPTGRTWRDLGALPVVAGEAPSARPVTRMAAFFHAGFFYLAGGQTYPDKRSSARVFRAQTL